jgi:hypothetical protein
MAVGRPNQSWAERRIRLTDRYRFEVKGEAFNLTNTPSFFRGDMDINGTTFGRITSVNVNSRHPTVGTFRLPAEC